MLEISVDKVESFCYSSSQRARPRGVAELKRPRQAPLTMPGSEVESHQSHKLESRVRLPPWPHPRSLEDKAPGYEPEERGFNSYRGYVDAATAADTATKIATWLSDMV